MSDRPTSSVESAEPPRVKICGLTRRGDAAHAAEAGAAFLGVVLIRESPRCLSPRRARAVVEGLGLPSVAVVADLSPEEAARAAEVMGASVLQLHGEESPGYVTRLRELGDWVIWKALQIREKSQVEEAVADYGPLVSGLLLDGWDPRRRGGTGKAFPWEAAEGARNRFPRHLLFIAAGGLSPENVSHAADRLRPDVVDVSSGVEKAPGIKDPERISELIRALGPIRREEAW